MSVSLSEAFKTLLNSFFIQTVILVLYFPFIFEADGCIPLQIILVDVDGKMTLILSVSLFFSRRSEIRYIGIF